MQSFAVEWSVHLELLSVHITTESVFGSLLICVNALVLLIFSTCIDNPATALRMTGTATTSLTVLIFRWLNRRNNGGRQFLLLLLPLVPSICRLETVTASPAFLAVSSSHIYYRLQGPDTARDTRSLLFMPSSLLCSLRSAPSSPCGANRFFCCETSSALKPWPTPISIAPAARGRAQFRNIFFGLKRSTEGSFSCSNVNPQFTLFSKGYPLRFTKDEVSASFAAAQLAPGRLSCKFTKKTESCRPMTVNREHAFSVESAAWPRARNTLALAGTSAAPAAQQVAEKDASHLFDALKRLRSLTSCSVVACREALVSCEGDVNAAVDWLRRRGMAGAGTSTAQASDTSEGLQTEGVVAVASWRPSPAQEGSNRQRQCSKGGTPSIARRRHEGEVALKLSCSTDFVARNKRITHFARRAATLLAEHLQEVGLQDILRSSAATTVHAEHRKGTRAYIASLDQPGRERLPSASVPEHPSQPTNGIVVVRGPPLVERLLNLPWNPGEEVTKGGGSDATAVETSLFGAGNFFQEQQQLVGAVSQQKRRQPARVSEKAKEQEQEQTKRKKLVEECTANERELKGMQSTIREELQYLSSIVREPLSITEAVAMETPVESGAVASYVHGIVDNQVGTLAVLAALSVEHDKNKCSALTYHQQSSTPAAPAMLDGMKDKRRVTQGLQLAQQQLQQEEETRQKLRGKKAEKELATSPQRQQTGQDGPQQKKQLLPETANIYGLAERMRSLAEGVCMQIAAGKPVAVDEHSLDRDLLKREESIYRAQAEATGKSLVTTERMVTGKVNKWLKDVLLSRQTWLLDDSGKTVQQKLSEFAVQQHMEKVPRIETFVKIQVH